MKGTESKKLESSFLAVCIAGGVGTIIYLALNKMGLTDFFGSKKPLDKESLAKEILKKEALVNENLKQEILVTKNLISANDKLKQDISNKQSFFKSLIKNEVSKNLEIAEEISSKLTNTKNFLENWVMISEYFIRKTELEIQEITNEYKKNEQLLTEHFSKYDSLIENKEQLLKEKDLLESKIKHLKGYSAASWILDDLKKCEKDLLKCNQNIENNIKELNETELKSEAIYKSFETHFDIAKVKNTNLAIYKENKTTGLLYLSQVTRKFECNQIRIDEIKSQKIEE